MGDPEQVEVLRTFDNSDSEVIEKTTSSRNPVLKTIWKIQYLLLEHEIKLAHG